MSHNLMPSTILLALLIILFILIVFVFVFYLYARRHIDPDLLNYQTHLTFVSNNVPVTRGGLDSTVLQSLPVKMFYANKFKEGLDCSVCLSVVVEGEEVRVLPKCNHGFHVKCIDMWFHSHSTCPLCRNEVSTDFVQTHESNAESAQGHSLDSVSPEGYLTEPQVLTTNVLFTGTVQEATSSSTGTVSRKRGGHDIVIDIPRRAMENTVPSPILPLPQSVMPLEEIRSPVSARFRSFKRLLSRGKQVVGPSASLGGGDIEQGIVHTSKTPRSFHG